ncbi:MAG: NADPH-dependent F420 reductase [Chloroflexi bacterium]|nr:NADPH-dependent F420 reductase [Chloroflexota bacterium]
MTEGQAIAIIGGTGKEGSGLALRWANAGYEIIIGSRSAEKAQAKAAELNALLGRAAITGAANLDAAQQAAVVVVSVPYAAHRPTLEDIKVALQGKVMIDVTVPLKPPKVDVVQLPEGRSAAEEAQALLGEHVRVVSAFQNVSAVHLKDLEHDVECDVLVSGDDSEAKEKTIELVEAAGMRGFDVGPLANAIVAEGITSLLIRINKRYKVKGAGIRITGLDH